jgi:putative resolvase
MGRYVSGKIASEILGVHQRTLYNWEIKGYIKTIRTPGGKRMYDVESYLMKMNRTYMNKLKICYVRVSSHGQIDDLKRQIKYMSTKYPNHVIIQDIGSGVNMNRKGLNKIIDLAIDGKISEVVIAYKDRLARFGYEQIERIIRKYSDGQIIIVNRKKEMEPRDELIEDVMQIMNVFIAKMNGLRKYKIK